MAIASVLRRTSFGWRVALLTIVSGLLILAVNLASASLQAWIASLFPGITPGEAAYLAFILTTLLMGFCMIAVVWVVTWLEQPTSFRQFFKLGPIDWPSAGLFVLLIGLLDTLEVVVLGPLLYEPAQRFLASLGLWGQADNLSVGFTPDPNLLWLNLPLLLLVVWIEAPEEIFFRGYVQNHLQERIGPTWALFVGALIWDAWHLFAPTGFVRRLFFALGISLIFRLRQNTTALAIFHPLLNRLLLLFALLPIPR